MESPQEKIERLRRELDEHNYNYYVLNACLLYTSDAADE